MLKLVAYSSDLDFGALHNRTNGTEGSQVTLDRVVYMLSRNEMSGIFCGR